MTWYQGRQIVRKRVLDEGIRLDTFITSLLQNPPHRVEGVFAKTTLVNLEIGSMRNQFRRHCHIKILKCTTIVCIGLPQTIGEAFRINNVNEWLCDKPLAGTLGDPAAVIMLEPFEQFQEGARV